MPNLMHHLIRERMVLVPGVGWRPIDCEGRVPSPVLASKKEEVPTPRESDLERQGRKAEEEADRSTTK